MKCNLLALAALALVPLTGHAQDAEPAAPPTFPPEVLRADLDHLYATLKAAHYDLFARRPQAEYDAEYARVRRGIDAPLDIVSATALLQRFVAFGNVAHAQIPLPFGEYRRFAENGGQLLPFRIRVMDERVFVTENTSGIAALDAGAQILRIDDAPALEWLAARERYISADHPPLAHGLMEFWLEAIVWLEYGERERIAITVKRDDGERSFDVPFRTQAEIRAARAADERATLATDFNAREFRMLKDGVAYLRPGPFYNTDGEKTWDASAFRRFIDESFQKMLDENASDLIIDLRNNPGGDKSFSDPMVAWIADEPFQFYSTFRFKVSEPTRKAILARVEEYADLPVESARLMQTMAALVRSHGNGERVELKIDGASPRPAPRFEGRVYALINRHSYSNATAVAALLQDYGFATLLGEATHDLPSSYGAAESFALPGTGIEVHYPKSWFVRPNGDTRVHGVQPDVVIDTPIIEGAQDSVLDAAIEHVRKQR